MMDSGGVYAEFQTDLGMKKPPRGRFMGVSFLLSRA